MVKFILWLNTEKNPNVTFDQNGSKYSDESLNVLKSATLGNVVVMWTSRQ